MTGKAKNRQTPCFAYRGAGASIALILVLSLGTILAGCSIPSSGLTTPANRYALVIGVSKYCPNYAEGIYPNLRYSDNDAQEIAALLLSQGWNVKYELVNSDATFANIKARIADLSSDPDSTILVYYSGHGSIDESSGTPYIIPQDGIIDLGTSYTSGGVTYPYYSSNLNKWITPATLTSWMSTVTAKNKLLILDSCNSGGFTLGNSAVDTAQADYSQLSYHTLDKGILIGALSKFGAMVTDNLSTFGDQEVLALSASGLEEVSWEDSANGHGVFTNYLLKAVDFGDADGDGYVTVNEAYAYTKKQIRENWNIDYLHSSDPLEWDFLPHISGGTGDLVLYDNPGP